MRNSHPKPCGWPLPATARHAAEARTESPEGGGLERPRSRYSPTTVSPRASVTRDLKSASSQGLTGNALVLLEWEVRDRLDLLIVGNETEHQVDETMEAAIERSLFELVFSKEQAEHAQLERLLNQCLTFALPLAVATLPWIKTVVTAIVLEMLSLHSSADSTPTESPASSSDSQEAKPADPATPHPIRRRRPDLGLLPR